ncbi:hypothetical protein XBKB1_4010001 [Xenorhabdus bovienii str. kraussei Becker Underwood]|uniref:Uncharacterized protein n=1 Tax=Xenorhabdus bovienii str. kraussei Becker Underwood TaxID=1398204 RepID=A0A077PWD0_XENBV|nr:hypothetical protein XBKB1_4010001 [Xenorhabdus bovienii str. kraussei Becker Underwood]
MGSANKATHGKIRTVIPITEKDLTMSRFKKGSCIQSGEHHVI